MNRLSYFFATTFCIAVILFSSVSSVHSDDTLEFYWDFSEGTGTSTGALSGYPGTLYGGPSWVSGGGVSFDGINDYARTNSPLTESMGVSDQAYTLSASVRVNDANESGNIIHISDGANGLGWCISMLHIRNGYFRAIGWQDDQPVTAVDTVPAVLGEWYSIANTWSPETDSLDLYVNGTLVASTPMVSYQAADEPVYVFAGIDAGNCDNDQGWFKGDVKDVRIYSRAITEEEAEDNSNASLGTISADLSPEDNEQDVELGTNLVMTFSTSTVATSTGSIAIYKDQDDSLFEEFDIDSDRISIDEEVVTIDPTEDFDWDTEYYVMVEDIVFEDVLGNTYPGITSSSSWSFVTIEEELESPTLTTVAAIPSEVRIEDAKYYFNLSNPSEVEGEFLAEELITDDSTAEVIINMEGQYLTIGGMEAGYTYQTAFTFNYNEGEDSTETLQVGPFTVIKEEDESPRRNGDRRRIIGVSENSVNPVSVGAPVLVRNLTVGMTGSDVLALQKLLNASGFMLAATGAGSAGNETTTFGSLTRAALAKYQAANGIVPAIGYFGPITRAQMKAAGHAGLWW